MTLPNDKYMGEFERNEAYRQGFDAGKGIDELCPLCRAIIEACPTILSELAAARKVRGSNVVEWSKVQETLALAQSMIACDEKHSPISEALFKRSFAIIDAAIAADQEGNEQTR